MRMTRSRAAAVTLPGTFSPVRCDQSLRRRASRAATMHSSYLLEPCGGMREASLVMRGCSSWGSRVSGHRAQTLHARALGVHDGGQAGDRLLQVVVHHQVVVLAPLGQLAGGVAQP